MQAIKSVWLYGKLNSNHAIEVLHATQSHLQQLGCDVFLCPDCPAVNISIPKGTKAADLIIVIGGDGSFLQAARLYNALKVPMIGICTGVLGFLTDISPVELKETLSMVIQNPTTQENRTLLDIQQIQGEQIYQFIACNEAIIHQGHFSRAIGFEILVNDVSWLQTQADGVMVSTPTGSTAYALSAGGPIISPDAAVLLLSALNPHSLSYRHSILSDATKITCILQAKSAIEPKLSIDGQQIVDLNPTDTIVIQKHPIPLCLLHPKGYQFAQTLRSKLGWDYHQRQKA